MQTRSSPARAGPRFPIGQPRRGLYQRAFAFLLTLWRTSLQSVQDLPPQKASLSLALGLVLGIFPVFGTTSILGAAVGGLLRPRIHVPTLLLGVLVATPAEVALIPPFLRLGATLLRMAPIPLAPAELWKASPPLQRSRACAHF